MRLILRLLGFAAQTCFAVTVYAHGPDGAKHQMAQLGDMTLESGAVVKSMKMSYVTHGKLNATKDNAILVLHGFGANHHGFDGMIGPGKPLDTDKYFVIASDAFGNTQVGFDHSTSPTNSGLKMAFPKYNWRDMIQAQHKLVTEGIGAKRLRAVLGISMGGTQAIQYAVMHPTFIDAIVPIVSSTRNGPELFFYSSQVRRILESCTAWREGNYTENSTDCAGTALWTFVSYFFSQAWWEKNIKSQADFDGFRNAWTQGYFGVQDMRDLHYHAHALSSSTIESTPGFNGDLSAALKAIRAKTMIVYSPNDQFFMPTRVEWAAAQIKDAQAVAITSDAGHLMCCGVDQTAYRAMGESIRGLLSEISAMTNTAAK